MKSQQPWFPPQDEVHCLPGPTWKRELFFFEGVTTSKFSMLQWMTPYNVYMDTLIGLNEFRKSSYEVGRSMREGCLGGVRGVSGVIRSRFFVLYMYKISKHLKRIKIQLCVPIFFLRAKTPTTNAVGLDLHLAQVEAEKLLSASLLTTDPASTYFTVLTFQVCD